MTKNPSSREPGRPDNPPDPAQHIAPGDRDDTRAHGRYGLEEEPKDAPPPEPPVPKTPEEKARDAARDRAVRETGEDLGEGRGEE